MLQNGTVIAQHEPTPGGVNFDLRDGDESTEPIEVPASGFVVRCVWAEGRQKTEEIYFDSTAAAEEAFPGVSSGQVDLTPEAAQYASWAEAA